MKVDLKLVAKYQRWMPWLIVLGFIWIGILIADGLSPSGSFDDQSQVMTRAEIEEVVVLTLASVAIVILLYALFITIPVLLLAAMRQPLRLRVVVVLTSIIPLAAIVNLIWINQWAKRLLREGAGQGEEPKAEST